MALPQRLSGVDSCEPSSVTSHVMRLFSPGCVTSLHLLRLQSGPLCASQPSLFPWRNRGTLHVLPRATAPPSALRGLFTTVVALAVFRSSELSFLNADLVVLLSSLVRADSPQHTRPRAAGGLLVLHHRSHLLRTLRVGSLNSCHRFSFGKLHHQRESSPRSENGIKLHEQQQRQTIRKLFCFCLWDILPLRGPLGLKAEQINSNYSPNYSITLQRITDFQRHDVGLDPKKELFSVSSPLAHDTFSLSCTLAAFPTLLNFAVYSLSFG